MTPVMVTYCSPVTPSGRGLTPVTSSVPGTQSLPAPRRRMIQGAARSAMAPMMSSMTAISTTPDMVGPLL